MDDQKIDELNKKHDVTMKRLVTAFIALLSLVVVINASTPHINEVWGGRNLVIPLSDTKAQYVPIMTNNMSVENYICAYAPNAIASRLYQFGFVGKGFDSIYSLKGQLELANLGKMIQNDKNNTTPQTGHIFCS
jgi:hypothetical protein